MRQSLLAVAAIVAAAAALSLPLCSAAPFSVYDLYQPPCPGGFIQETSSTAYVRWSNPASWPNNVVPGVGAQANVNVSIPCGVAMLLDVPRVNVTVLNIRGLLRVVDNDTLPTIEVFAAFIVVEGQLYAGTPTAQYSKLLTFTLMPNPNNRASFNFPVDFPGIANPPADLANPRSFGHKAFVVVGGQVRLHGLPGPQSMLAYTKLSRSISNLGDSIIFVEGDVTNWPAGRLIVISSTDFFPDQAEVGIIMSTVLLSDGTTRISLTRSLRNSHYGDKFGIPDGFGGFVDERAEVALLNRNIVITGLDEPIPNNYEGGHFMVWHTEIPQFIEGVEFFRMGQQGILGRYNIHFHLSGNHNQSLVRKNVLRDSKQRCVVIHTTFFLTVDTNVAYNTSGHCYIVEEGGETNNTFIRNLGIRTRGVDRVIPPSFTTLSGTASESDGSPSTFWITNPLNNYIDNIAAGSDNSGFWFELRGTVRGNTAVFAPYNWTIPSYAALGIFRGNVAHSNRGPGLRFYPSGYRPRTNWTIGASNWNLYNQVELYSLTSWKHAGEGVFVHNSDSISLVDFTLADNRVGVNINANQAIQVRGGRFVGLTNNFGNPVQCDNNPWLCGPIAPSCTFPIPANGNGRSQGWNNWRNPVVGIVVDHQNIFDGDKSPGPHFFDNNKFSAFDPTCRPAAAYAVGINGGTKHWWGAGHSFSRTQLTADASAVFLPPLNFTFGDGGTFLTGETGKLYTYYDRDGSVVGGNMGFVVANNPALLPPRRFPDCSFNPSWNAYACPNVCYRSVQVFYQEEGFVANPNNKWKDWSFLQIKRIEDGKVLTLEGNLRWGDNNNFFRYFNFPVVGGTTYELNIGLPTNNPRFVPGNMTIQFRDGPNPCAQGVTFRIVSRFLWTFSDHSDIVSYGPCPGIRTATQVQFNEVCYKAKKTFQVRLTSGFQSTVQILRSRFSSPPCQLQAFCSILPSGSNWQYDISGNELHQPYPGGPAFHNPLYDSSSWPTGPAPIGWISWNWWAIRTWTRKSNSTFLTSYFRTSFNLINSACVTNLFVDIMMQDGFVIYINNVEVFRRLLPDGNVSAVTGALQDNWPQGRQYITYSLPVNTSAPFSLVDGNNSLAVEVHVCGWGCTESTMDMRIWAQTTLGGCRGAPVRTEVCDGVDNDGDGTVDIDPATGQPFQRPCSTSCGVGTETCIKGAFQGCTAPKSFPEICNGIDDDCDGMVDDGPGQLDCPSGLVCYRGKCLQRTGLTVPVVAVTKNATDWYYTDTGDNIPRNYPNWTTAEDLNLNSGLIFKKGAGTFGTPLGEYAAQTQTIVPFLPSDGTSVTYYFLKSFTLTAQQAGNTQSLQANVRRDDGVVVYINGIELFRSGMPDGVITSRTLSNGVNPPTPSGNPFRDYIPSVPTRNTSSLLKTGLNWLAAEVHQAQTWGDRWMVFDMDLWRNTNVACASLPGAPTNCVRNPPMDTVILPRASNWTYLDASMPLPSFDWTSPTFDDSSWPNGAAFFATTNQLVNPKTWLKSGTAMNNSRMAYYFRTTVNIPDGSCYYNITFQHRVMEGAVFYINGAEAFRTRMPTASTWPVPIAPIYPTTPATVNWWMWGYDSFSVAGGYFKQGLNTIAVEAHHFSTPGPIIFDLGIIGQREGVNCPQPLP